MAADLGVVARCVGVDDPRGTVGESSLPAGKSARATMMLRMVRDLEGLNLWDLLAGSLLEKMVDDWERIRYTKA